MAKKKQKKETVIHPRTGQHLLICVGMLAVAIGVLVALGVGLIPNDFRFGVIGVSLLLGGIGLAYGAMVILPSRIILTEKCVVIKSITGKVRAQIPYANIAQVKLHYAGDESQEQECVGIDVIKAKSRDTWWPRTYSGHTYDIELADFWVQPPRNIVRMIQSKIDRYFENRATK